MLARISKLSSLKSTFIPLCFSLLLTACGGGGSSSVSAPITEVPDSTPTTAELRLQELNIIDTAIRNNHPDMFFKLSETDWQNHKADIEAQLGTLSTEGFLFEATKWVATLGDQHTYMIMPDEFLRKFPFEIWWDDERAIVVKATDDYSAYLGHEVKTIDGVSMVEIRETMMQYLAFENDYWKVGISHRYVNQAQALAYEGLINSSEVATVDFISPDNEPQLVDVTTSTGNIQMQAIEETQDSVPAYYQNRSDNFSVQLVEDDVYIQYNSAFDTSSYPLSALIDDVHELIGTNSIDNVIVDIRFNLGGQIDHFVPMIEYLANSRFNNPDDLFVLTGRQTFSSGVGATYSFVEMTNATFVGMPTGGKPNGFSNVVGLGLSYSLANLFLSLEYLQLTEGDPDTFMPEHLTPFTQHDFITGNDPALTFIRENW